MSENFRIEQLRRRLCEDPASIAFAQLGEELRRAGRPHEAVDGCRARRAPEIPEQGRDPEGKTAFLASRRRRTFDDREYVRARRTIIALESWLFAIHVARARRRA